MLSAPGSRACGSDLVWTQAVHIQVVCLTDGGSFLWCCNQSEVTARRRIARTLGLRRPTRGACIPSVYRPVDPSLGLMRADIGAASLSLFGDPYELDPFDR